MGTVYEAYDTESDRPVALKILSKQVRTTEEGVDRFRRESQVAASINHPGSTFVYRSGQCGDRFFIAMELMNGGTLKDVVEEEGPLEVSRAVDFILDAIDGLAVAHSVGIVHRDFKPSNCFMDDDGKAKVGDFGLAKSFYGDVALTQTGAFVGTPQFAAPEQLRSGHVDARTDIYAVGGTLFYLLTSRAPFVGDAAQVIAGIAAETAPNIKTIAPHVPGKLASLLAGMLEKDPAKRPSSLKEIRESLLPFSSLGAVPADRGQRMAAFFIDTFAFGFASLLLGSLLTPLAVFLGPETGNRVFTLINMFTLIFWFAFQEYFFGATIGKWLFRMRVVNSHNESPKLWQAFVRPLLIPGLRAAIMVIPVFVISGDANQIKDVADIANLGLILLLSILSWIPCMLLMLTAKLSNGYRGIHDLLTNTRVVRISNALHSKGAETSRPVTAPMPVDPDSFPVEAIAPFEVLGIIGKDEASGDRIFVGRDPELERKVWIYESANDSAPFLRAGIRPTRQRIIATGTDQSVEPNRNYFVAECIEGLPLVELVESSDSLQWTTCRPLLRELASELERAESEGSLPTAFSERNVWLDKSAQLKLVEVSESSDIEATSARDVFDSLFAKIVEQHPVPEHVIELSQKWHGSESTTFSEIVDSLDDIEDRPSSWSWIDRIGITCVSLALELSVLMLMGQLWLTFCKMWTELSPLWICGSFGVIMTVLAFAVGFFFENPTFWFLGISARRRNKLLRPSRFQMALRLCLSWILPVGFAISLIGVEAATIELNNGEPPITLMVVGLLFMAVIAAMLMVTLFNLAKPARGVADLVCGTQLMRK
jgi:uncharacterized RDD family membrane protein YckC